MRRVGPIALTIAVAVGGAVALLLFLQGRDSSQIGDGGAVAAPGSPLTDGRLPDDLRAAGRGARPDDERVVALLRRGNVVLVYGDDAAAEPLRALARDVAGPSDPALEQSGQAIVLARRPGVDGVAALAWERILRVADPADPTLEEFASYWLGHGARD